MSKVQGKHLTHYSISLVPINLLLMLDTSIWFSVGFESIYTSKNRAFIPSLLHARDGGEADTEIFFS